MKYITAQVCTEKLANSKTKKMIDLGCGIGIIGEYVKKLDPEINITGIDLDDKRLEQAKSKNVYEKLMFCDVTSDEIDFSKFDLILTADVLEHLSFPDLFLTSLRNKIKDIEYLIS